MKSDQTCIMYNLERALGWVVKKNEMCPALLRVDSLPSLFVSLNRLCKGCCCVWCFLLYVTKNISFVNEFISERARSRKKGGVF
mmetsp:Transcript_2354/g.4389  ORF Transcript_2354/g.4389 Transcript_2354/m.4389 type:complete len:84 (-) Transcript_2354:1069-1320(-)